MDSSLSDIKNILQQMSPEEQREALSSLGLSALNAMAAKGKASLAPEPEEYTLEESERLFGNQAKTATAYFRKPLSIRGITLLSHSQFMAYRDRIPLAEKTWWLLDSIQDSKGNFRHYYVNLDGQSITASPDDYTNRGVRPVLILSEDSEAEVGNTFNIEGIPFRMITNRLALCDRTLFAEIFRKHYLSSRIKTCLQVWLENNSEKGTGTVIHFGRYKWHPNGDPEPIEWLVLRQEDGRMLLISKHILDYGIFDKKMQAYENSEVRTWLHESFFPEAFSEEEQKKILPGILFESGLEEDRVFLLNSKEAIKMLNKEERLGIYSPYVRKKYHLTAANPGHWWCRDALGPCPENYPYYVGKDGKIHYQYCSEETTKWNSKAKKCEPLPEPAYNIKPKGIRPCIWIRTE